MLWWVTFIHAVFTKVNYLKKNGMKCVNFIETPSYKLHRSFLVRKNSAFVTPKECVKKTRSARLFASAEDILYQQTRRTFCRLSRNAVGTRKSGF
jgi:hypothetical protein